MMNNSKETKGTFGSTFSGAVTCLMFFLLAIIIGFGFGAGLLLANWFWTLMKG
jgi:hypothetical protein